MKNKPPVSPDKPLTQSVLSDPLPPPPPSGEQPQPAVGAMPLTGGVSSLPLKDNYQIQYYQKSLLYDEAISSWMSRNRVKEALVAKIAQLISQGQDPSNLISILDKISNPDSFTQKILDKLT